MKLFHCRFQKQQHVHEKTRHSWRSNDGLIINPHRYRCLVLSKEEDWCIRWGIQVVPSYQQHCCHLNKDCRNRDQHRLILHVQRTCTCSSQPRHRQHHRLCPMPILPIIILLSLLLRRILHLNLRYALALSFLRLTLQNETN